MPSRNNTAFTASYSLSIFPQILCLLPYPYPPYHHDCPRSSLYTHLPVPHNHLALIVPHPHLPLPRHRPCPSCPDLLL